MPTDDEDTLQKLVVPGYRGRVERGMLIKVEAFDWNCPQHILPKYNEADVLAATQSLRDHIASLEAELAAAKNAG